MTQTIYGLIAIMLVMMLALNVMRIVTGTERRMVTNEVATQVRGLAVDVMEHVGNKWFDEAINEEGIEAWEFPLVTSVNQLTAESGFGNTGDGAACDHTTPNFYDPDCDDIDDFDGMTLDREINGIPFTAAITVQYINPDNPDLPPPGGRTFAKEVVVVISSPFLRLGDDPITVTLRRVFAYNRITN